MKEVRRRRVTGPPWIQYPMPVLQALLDRLNRFKEKGIRPLGGRYPQQRTYALI